MKLSTSTKLLLIQLACAACVLALLCKVAATEEPKPQLTVPCEITEVYDGDTVTVRVTLSLRVRLLDCWAPEIRSSDKHEKQLGLAARDHLRDLVFRQGATGSASAILSIPIADMDRFDDAITLGRVLGHVHLVDDPQSLSDHMRNCGQAYRTKADLQAVLQAQPTPAGKD